MSEHEEGMQPKRGRGRPRLDDQMVPLILDASEKLFAQRGVQNVSVRDIAAEAGIPHSAIYRYFSSKHEIMLRVIERGQGRQSERDESTRATGTTMQGATSWFMEHSRGLLAVERQLALEGETLSSLGLEYESGSRNLRAMESDYPFEPCTELEPRAALAALMALAFGLGCTETWIMDAVGLEESDRDHLRSQMDCLFAGIMRMGQEGARKGNSSGGEKSTVKASNDRKQKKNAT